MLEPRAACCDDMSCSAAVLKIRKFEQPHIGADVLTSPVAASWQPHSRQSPHIRPIRNETEVHRSRGRAYIQLSESKVGDSDHSLFIMQLHSLIRVAQAVRDEIDLTAA